MTAAVSLRPYRAEDEDAAIALWLRTWQATYPAIDFSARLDWWCARWRNELVVKARIVLAEEESALIGFVTVDPETLYLDQFVVAPEHWGTKVGFALIDAAKRLSPKGLDLDVNCDNARAIAFYRKAGFAIAGDGVNALSGRPVYRMSFRG